MTHIITFLNVFNFYCIVRTTDVMLDMRDSMNAVQK